MRLRESRLTEQKPLFPGLDENLFERYGWSSGGPTDSQTQDVWDRCKVDPEFFIFGGFVRTFGAPNRRHPVQPFPDYPYTRFLLQHIHPSDIPDDEQEPDVVAFPKSRQMALTWIVCAYCSWEARFHPHSLCMIQSKKAEDAWKLVYKQDWMLSRIGFIERAMPNFLRSNGLVATRGELSYTNGSQIWGVPQGAHMFRGYTARLVVSDECCFQDKFEEAYTALLSMARRIILVSTAKNGTFFGKLIEAEAEYEEAA